MDQEQYRQEVLRTYAGTDDPLYALSLGAMGLAGESGEVVDHIKKVLFQGHVLEGEALVEELGDVLWYVVLLCETVRCSLSDVMEANVKKLRERYPDGFDQERSIHRENGSDEDGYCWAHTPGGRHCQQCRELREVGLW